MTLWWTYWGNINSRQSRKTEFKPHLREIQHAGVWKEIIVKRIKRYRDGLGFETQLEERIIVYYNFHFFDLVPISEGLNTRFPLPASLYAEYRLNMNKYILWMNE